MSRPQKIILAAGGVAFGVIWLFPPLTVLAHLGDSPPDTYGFRFAKREVRTVTTSLVINERRLFHQQVALIVVTGVLLLAFRSRIRSTAKT